MGEKKTRENLRMGARTCLKPPLSKIMEERQPLRSCYPGHEILGRSQCRGTTLRIGSSLLDHCLTLPR